jgi:hypothetical protein
MLGADIGYVSEILRRSYLPFGFCDDDDDDDDLQLYSPGWTLASLTTAFHH